MNHDTDKQSEVDPDLSARYRSIANEAAPAELNHVVMRKAAKAAKSGTAGAWRSAWYRPAAFAATLVLSLALILQFTDEGLLGPATDYGNTTDEVVVPPAAGTAFEEAANATLQQLRDAQTEASTSMMASQPESAAGTDSGTAQSAIETLLPHNDRCSDEDRADTASWWACIQELEKQGLTQAAELELQALLEAFPLFRVPE